MRTPATMSTLACWMALAALPLPSALAFPTPAPAPASVATAPSSTLLAFLATPQLLSPSAPADDRAFLLHKAPSVALVARLDPAAGALSFNREVVDLSAVDGGLDVLAAPVCTGAVRVGAYAAGRWGKGKGKRVGVALVPKCVEEGRGEEGGVKVGVTYSASLKTIGGLPVDDDSTVAVPFLHLSLTYSPSSLVPTSATLTLVSPPRAASASPLPGISVKSASCWVQRHLMHPLSSVGAQLSSLILSLSAMAAILWAVWSACDARREGAIRLREVGEADDDADPADEEVWVVAVDKV